MVLIPGKILLLIKISAGQTAGAVLHLMRKKGSYMLLQDQPHLIFMEEKEKDKTFLPIVCWHWMLLQANASGISSLSIMISGIRIFPHHLLLLQLRKTGKGSGQLPKLQKTRWYGSLTGKPGSLFILM